MRNIISSKDQRPFLPANGNRPHKGCNNPILNSKALWLSAYFMCSLCLTIYNKAIMQLLHFPLPCMLTGIHTFIGWMGFYLLAYFGVFTPMSLTKEQKRAIILFSLLYTLNSVVSNISLSLVTVPVHQVARAIVPAITIFLSGIFFNKSYSILTYLSLVPVIIGVLMATFGDYYFSMLGFIVSLIDVVLASVKTIVTNKVQVGKYKLPPLDLFYYMSPLVFAQTLMWAFLFGEHNRFVSLLQEGKLTQEVSGFIFVVAILGNGALAFLFNYVSFPENGVPSPFMMSVAGNMGELLSVILSIFIFSLKITGLNALGISLTSLGCALNTSLQLKRKNDMLNPPELKSKNKPINFLAGLKWINSLLVILVVIPLVYLSNVDVIYKDSSTRAGTLRNPQKICVAQVPDMFIDEIIAEIGNVEDSLSFLKPQFSLENKGFGKKVKDFIYETNQFSSSAIFYSLLALNSPFMSNDCSEADLVFVPNLIVIHFQVAARRFWNSRNTTGLEPYLTVHEKFLDRLFESLPYIQQKPHLIILGRIERDYFGYTYDAQGKQSVAGSIFTAKNAAKYTTSNLFYGVLEKLGELRPLNPLLNTIELPYPTSIHFNRAEDAADCLPTLNRTILMYGTWATRTAIRRNIKKTCVANPEYCVFVETTTMKYDRIKSSELTNKSVFCLNPPGDSPSRSQIYDSLVLGCIPVLWSTSDEIPLPFPTKIPWEKIVVRLNPHDEVVNYVETLRNFSENEIAERQDYMRKWRSVFQYSLEPNWPEDGGWSLSEALSLNEKDDALTAVLKEFTVAASESRV